MQTFKKLAFGGLGSAFRPLTPELGCAPCKAMQKQKEANEEFARRFGVVRDPRALPAEPLK
jgi:hypothetical protein